MPGPKSIEVIKSRGAALAALVGSMDWQVTPLEIMDPLATPKAPAGTVRGQ